MSKNVSLSKSLIFLIICCFSFSCALFDRSKDKKNEFGKVTAFSSVNGNMTIPGNQYKTSLDGKINPDNIAIHFSQFKKGNEVKKDFVLTGEDYQQCLKMIHNTNVTVKEITTGGDSSGVELIDSAGNKKFGEPSNKEEWERFDKKIYDQAMLDR